MIAHLNWKYGQLKSESGALPASKGRGFTLIELMLVVAILAILLAIGVPNLMNLMIKSRLSGQVQEFYGTISFARSEAIKRAKPVSICKISSSFNIDSPSCGGSWSTGWMVFVGDKDTSTITKSDVLRVFPPLSTNYTLNVNITNFATYITYNRLGMVENTGVGGTFVFCANSDETRARAITVTKTRPRIVPSTETISITSCESP